MILFSGMPQTLSTKITLMQCMLYCQNSVFMYVSSMKCINHVRFSILQENCHIWYIEHRMFLFMEYDFMFIYRYICMPKVPIETLGDM